MSFVPDPTQVTFNLDLGGTYTIGFQYTDPSYSLTNSILPAGFTVSNSQPGSWEITGTVTSQTILTNTFRFTISNLTNSINVTYNVTYRTINRFSCDSVNTPISGGRILVHFPCASTFNDTLLGNSISFDLILEKPNNNTYVFTPVDPSTDGLFLTIVFGTGGTSFTYRNAFQVDFFTFKLNDYDVYYNFSNIGDSDIINIRGTTPLSQFQNDNIMNGPNNDPSIPVIDCDLTNIPRIIITSINSNNYNNLDYNFSVFDTVKYDGTYCDSVLVCPNEKIYRTDFVKFPQIQTVLKGPTCKTNKCVDQCVDKTTLNDKIKYLIQNFDTGLSFADFYKMISFYAASRYILSGLLYGKFSVKFLLGKYYKQFLKDLRCSRFYKFLALFLDPQYGFIDYHQYFLYDLHCCGKQNKICHGNTNGCKIIIVPNLSN